ncbi:hypothetical protein BPOR_0023g00290 [Botrytis porri]|uniref:Uncharacterized protein n=1 Tax=Botrytis porri TaxID=87229 RepID=A0A4Z1L456_9HELO|nr:hypothetical protein BPOR_0023g00290 [Botrytis porri]
MELKGNNWSSEGESAQAYPLSERYRAQHAVISLFNVSVLKMVGFSLNVPRGTWGRFPRKPPGTSSQLFKACITGTD